MAADYNHLLRRYVQSGQIKNALGARLRPHLPKLKRQLALLGEYVRKDAEPRVVTDMLENMMTFVQSETANVLAEDKTFEWQRIGFTPYDVRTSIPSHLDHIQQQFNSQLPQKLQTAMWNLNLVCSIYDADGRIDNYAFAVDSQLWRTCNARRARWRKERLTNQD